MNILCKGGGQTYSEVENRRVGNFLMFSHGSVSESLENKSEVFIFNWSLKTRSLPLYEAGENKSAVFIFSCSLSKNRSLPSRETPRGIKRE